MSERVRACLRASLSLSLSLSLCVRVRMRACACGCVCVSVVCVLTLRTSPVFRLRWYWCCRGDVGGIFFFGLHKVRHVVSVICGTKKHIASSRVQTG